MQKQSTLFVSTNQYSHARLFDREVVSIRDLSTRQNLLSARSQTDVGSRHRCPQIYPTIYSLPFLNTEMPKSFQYCKAKSALDMPSPINLKTLRASVPEYCFKPSLTISLYYLFRDLALSIFLVIISTTFIPILPTTLLQIIAWSLYGWLQGLVFTGLWVSELS